MQFTEGQRVRLIRVSGCGLAKPGNGATVIKAGRTVLDVWIDGIGRRLVQKSQVEPLTDWDAVWCATGWHPLANVRP